MLPRDIHVKEIDVKSKHPIYFTGPSLKKGKLPGVIYFSIGGKDSLSLDPFNQFVQFLSPSIRVFSWDLPFHTPPLKPEKAINAWAEDLSKGNDLFSAFLQESRNTIDYLLQNFCCLDQFAIVGLSRGAFFALHLAAEKKIPRVLGFAPLLDLAFVKELQPFKGSTVLQKYALKEKVPSLLETSIRLFLGNHDTRVGSEKGFSFLQSLVKEAVQKKLRKFPFELEYYPSVGHLGHGTPPYIFQKGANWIETCMK